MNRQLDRSVIAGMCIAAFAVLSAPVAFEVRASAQGRGGATEATETFEVATIKENKTPIEGAQLGNFTFPPGRFSATNVTLRELIMFAYERQAFEIFGGPSWATSDRYDIRATAAASPTASSDPFAGLPRTRRMLRALLADRFRLVLHEETREMPVYALVVARPDRKLGARLRPADGTCVAGANAGALLPAPAPGAGPVALPLPGTESSSGPRPCSFAIVNGKMTARGMALSHLTERLATLFAVRRPVIDRTGLTGNFDFDLEWTALMSYGLAAPGAPDDRPAAETGPTIFTAVQEQLGLKMESTKESVPVLVIDGVNHPSAD